jgi:hypothetical protein
MNDRVDVLQSNKFNNPREGNLYRPNINGVLNYQLNILTWLNPFADDHSMISQHPRQ